MKNILVTGGAGYIGSHTCRALNAKGFSPITFDNLSYGHKEAVQWGPFILGDIKDTALLEQTIKEYRIDGVIHFAAYAYVGESVQNPIKYYDNNVLGSLSLLKALNNTNVKKIIFSSTCATYGTPIQIPIEESEKQAPINPYGKTKLMIEEILKDYGQSYGLKSASLRYFNASGASPDSKIGESHNPETHVIPLAIRSAITGSSFKIFGVDYPTFDGTCIRDYIHVEDLASAHIQAFLNLDNQLAPSEFFNLGTEKGFSVNEVIKAVEKVTDKKVNFEVSERRPGDPPILIANSQKAQKILNWKPQYLDIYSIVKTAYDWEMNKKY